MQGLGQCRISVKCLSKSFEVDHYSGTGIQRGISGTREKLASTGLSGEIYEIKRKWTFRANIAGV